VKKYKLIARERAIVIASVCAFVTCPQIHLNKLFRRYRLVCGLMGEKGDILAHNMQARTHRQTLGNKTQWDIEANAGGGINHCLL
jgi:hypothetical protein